MYNDLSNIILMKAGPYCDLSLDQIIDIKQKEEIKAGKFFWGYSGVFCRPHVIKNLVQNSNGEKVSVLFVETQSAFVPDSYSQFTQYSKDKNNWESLNKDVLLLGNKQKDHFAITAKNLKSVSIDLDLTQYCTLKGVFPNENQRFDKYFKYRVDKACGVLKPLDNVEKESVQVKYIAELVEPYSVYIR